MIQVTLDSILSFLKSEGYDAKPQEATNQIYIIFNIGGREFPLFIKESNKEIVQLLIFMPTKLEPKYAPDIARLLHLLNREIDLPGFGMDETAGVIFYRSVLPATDGKISTNLLRSLMTTVPRIAAVGYPLVLSINSGGTRYDGIVGRAKETLQRFAKQKD